MVSQVLAQAILNQQAPDVVGQFRAGQEVARQQRARTLAGEALQQGGGAALDELRGVDPQVALQLGQQIQAQSANDLNEFIRDAGIGQRFLQSNNVQGFLDFARQRSAILRQQGRDSTQTDRMIQLASSDPSQALRELQDFTGAVEGAKQVAQVQSSDILPDGTTIQVLKDGSTRVTSPQGVELSGEDRSEAIRQAREFGVEISGESAAARAGQAQLAKDRQEIKKSVFGAARQGRRTVREIDQLQKALDAVRTGRLAAARRSLGGLIPGVADADEQALTSAINEFVLRRKDELLGGGVLSDADIVLLQGVGPQLGNTIEANQLIIDRFRTVAENDIARGKRLRDFKGDPLEFEIETFEEESTPQGTVSQFNVQTDTSAGRETTVKTPQATVQKAQAQTPQVPGIRILRVRPN